MKKLGKRNERISKSKAAIEEQQLELVNAKKEALDSINRARHYEKNVELVRDDSYNRQLLQKISDVEEKIDQLDLIFTQLLSRGRFIGRE